MAAPEARQRQGPAVRPLVLDDASVDPALHAPLRGLCFDAFGDGFTEDDWRNAAGGTRVLLLDGSAPVAHGAVVARTLDVGGQPWTVGYVEAVAVAPARQGQGLGTRLIELVSTVVRGAYPLGVLSTGRHRLYERAGWERWRGPAYVRTGGVQVRMPDEDDGLMVLRTAATPDLDLGASITCEDRPGDPW